MAIPSFFVSSILFMFVHCADNVIHHRQVLLLTDVHAFMCGEHVLARLGFRTAGARAEKFACHPFGVFHVFDVLEAGFDDGVIQMCSNDVVHEAGNAISSTQTLIECSSHDEFLSVLQGCMRKIK